MGTVLVEEADPPLSVTKSDEVFAEKPHSFGVPARTRVNSSFSSFESMIPVLPTVFLREFL